MTILTEKLICVCITLYIHLSWLLHFSVLFNKNQSEDWKAHFKNDVFQILFNLNRFVEINGTFRQKSEESLFILGQEYPRLGPFPYLHSHPKAAFYPFWALLFWQESKYTVVVFYLQSKIKKDNNTSHCIDDC